MKNKLPDNCIIAGNPAKIIATNRCWARKNGVADILECGEENVALKKCRLSVDNTDNFGD